MYKRTKLQKLIDQLDHRLDLASKAYHNTREWLDNDVCEGDGFLGTYDEWIEQAFAELRDEAKALRSTEKEGD